MNTTTYTAAWDRFLTAARLGSPDQVPVALIVDSPWLPGYAGFSPLMEGMMAQTEQVNKILETVTTSLIRWLEAQLGTLRQPEGILLLDDLVGMVSRRTYEKMVEPHL